MPAHAKPPKTCGHCRRLYRPKDNYGRAKYCSRACSYAARPHLDRVEMGRKGGRAKAAKQIGGVLRQTAQRIVTSGMTPLQAFVAGATWQRKRERNRDYTRGRRAGYAAGYEAALRDLQPAYAAGTDLVSRGRVRAGDALLEGAA